jgi:hypothetical protein
LGAPGFGGGIGAGVLQGLVETVRTEIFSRDVTQENVSGEMKKTLRSFLR